MRKSLARDWAGKVAGRVLRLGLGLLAGLALLTTTAAAGTPPAAMFSAAVNYAVGLNPHGVAVGDFNKDGNLDLAVANENSSPPSVSILLGDGKGGFAAAPGSPFSVAPGSGPIAIAVGHFTSSSNLDIVTANQGSGDVSILLGDGKGGFTPALGSPVSVGVGSSPSGLAVGDFNGDGKLDLAVTDLFNSNVVILLGKGDGTFQAPVPFSTVSSLTGAGLLPAAVVAADFGNGKLDLATANQDGTVSILLGNGDGTFGAASSVNVVSVPHALAAGDFNGDKNVDLLVAAFDSFGNSVSVLLGDGKGGFMPPQPPNPATATVAVGLGPSAIVVGDFNGDGLLDFVTANVGDNDGSLVLGNGDGTFQPAVSLPMHVNPVVVANPVALAAGDFNSDQKLDLAFANESSGDVSVLNTTQNAPPPPPPPPPPSPISVTLSPNTAQTLVQGQTLLITATVANDAQNRGVNWSATCSPSPCGTFSPTSTPSGTPTTYTAPTPVSANLTVTVAATSVSDSTKSASLTVTVINLPPTASAGPNKTITCAAPKGAMVTLSGSGADPDGDTLSFAWLEGSNVLPNVTVVNNVATVTVLVSPGTHTYTLKVDDGHGNVAMPMPTTQVTVIQATPPSLSPVVLSTGTVTSTKIVLWPPNNEMVPFTAQVQVSDNCDPHPTMMLSIWSNDRDRDMQDIRIMTWNTFLLRARKADGGRERIYTVTYRAMDVAGNQAFSPSAQVIVPHSLGHHGLDDKHGKRRKGD